MPQELEAKWKVVDFGPVRRALAAAGAEFRGAVRQSDVFFDRADGSLRAADRALRLRRLDVIDAPAGGQSDGWLLTAKGPRGHCDRAKVRQEIQTAVADGEAVRAILSGLGLSEQARLEKRRASYALDECLVELDEVPPLGCFVEIEAPDEARLEAMRSRLGLDGPAIVESYLKLMEARDG